jgi:hypothetical protein
LVSFCRAEFGAARPATLRQTACMPKDVRRELDAMIERVQGELDRLKGARAALGSAAATPNRPSRRRKRMAKKPPPQSS